MNKQSNKRKKKNEYCELDEVHVLLHLPHRIARSIQLCVCARGLFGVSICGFMRIPCDCELFVVDCRNAVHSIVTVMLFLRPFPLLAIARERLLSFTVHLYRAYRIGRCIHVSLSLSLRLSVCLCVME